MGRETKAVAQRGRQEAGTSRRSDDRERREREGNRGRSGAFTDDDVDAEVLHRQIEHLLGGAREAVDLVDEEDIPFLKAGENRREVPRVLDRGAGGQAQGCAHLGCDNHRERRLTQSRRTRQEDVVGAGRTHAHFE